MRYMLFLLFSFTLNLHIYGQGLSRNGWKTSSPVNYINANGAEGTVSGVNQYGEIITGVALPTVTTAVVTGITAGTAVSGGEVTDDGGGTVSRGICWSSSPNPTTSLSTKISNGTGTGTYSSSLTRLTPGTTYYVRAYAVNSAGTVYGPQQSFTTAAVAVGENFGGGKVAYILQPGDPGYDPGSQHGLIAAAADLGDLYYWGPSAVSISTSVTLGSGAANTNAIVAAYGSGSYAARACYNYSKNGYSDWYLPSKDELDKLYTNQDAIGGFKSDGTSFYWSSSQSDDSEISVWMQLFSSGGQNDFSLSYPIKYNVRPVRSF